MFAFAVTERKENRTLREKGVRTSYGAPTRHTSATLDFKEWRRVFVFLWRFLLTSLCRTRLALTLLWSTRLILTIYRPIFCPENRAFIIYTLYIWSKSAMGDKQYRMGAPQKTVSFRKKYRGIGAD